MKLTRYIRPTTRRTAAQQIAATARDGIAITIIEGDQRRTWADALKQLRPGGGLLIEDIGTLGRRYETRRERIEAVAAKGASIVLADGSVHGPGCLPSIVAGMSAPKIDAPRRAHNRAPDETLAEARRLWTGRHYRAMTNGQIADAVGLSIPTLTRYFGPRGVRRPGRPRKSKPPETGSNEGESVNYKRDDQLSIDGRLIHQAAGVLHAASVVQQNADRAPSRREREMLEALADDLRDLAHDMREHHQRITQAK